METTNRVPLTSLPEVDAGRRLDFGDYQCEGIRLISSAGASGLVYHATSPNYYGVPGAAEAKLIVKECYPQRLVRHLVREGAELSLSPAAPKSAQKEYESYLQSYREAFAKQTHLYQGRAREYVSVPSRAREANGTIYIVTDVSNGATLAQQAPDMSVKALMDALGMTCGALDALHSEGYAYLDLKPENILIVPSSDMTTCAAVRLFDFDACQRIGEKCEGGLVMGTRGWSSYEQMHEADERSADARSDVYSLGALLFWVLVGRAPTYAEIIHADGVWRLRPSNLAAGREMFCTDEALALTERILGKTLVAEPDRRYNSVAEFAADLNDLAGFVVPATRATRDAVAGLRTGVGEDLFSAVSEQRAARQQDQARLRKRIVAGIALAAVLVVAVGAAVLHPWADSTEGEADESGLPAVASTDGATGADGSQISDADGSQVPELEGAVTSDAGGLSEASMIGHWDAMSYVEDIDQSDGSDLVLFSEGERYFDFAADGSGVWFLNGSQYGCTWALAESRVLDDGADSLVFTVKVADEVYDFTVWENEGTLVAGFSPRGGSSSTIYGKDVNWAGSGLEATAN